MWPTREDARRMVPAVLRGTALGAFFGVLPGAGAAVASFSSYAMEKKISRHSDEFGRGAIEGVAGPESANNAAAQTAFIPLLTLGLPASATMAMMLGAMTIHSIQPGPQVMVSDPALFWGLIVSMWIGNLFLIVLNLPLIGMWVSLLKVPYRLLYPAILVFSSIGVYTVSNSNFDVYLVCLFGVIGYLFSKLKCEPAPLLLGFVLGPLMEENFRRALLLSDGSFTVFLTRPISLALLVMTAILLLAIVLPAFRKTREKAFVEA
jgi:TctA family transporter